MKTTLHLDTKIELSVSQLTALAKQLPKKERMKLASALLDDGSNSMTKAKLVAKIQEGLEEVEMHNNGEKKLPTLEDFLANI